MTWKMESISNVAIAIKYNLMMFLVSECDSVYNNHNTGVKRSVFNRSKKMIGYIADCDTMWWIETESCAMSTAYRLTRLTVRRYIHTIHQCIRVESLESLQNYYYYYYRYDACDNHLEYIIFMSLNPWQTHTKRHRATTIHLFGHNHYDLQKQFASADLTR